MTNSPFHSSSPFEHLGLLSLYVNKVTFFFYFRTETVSLLKSIQHLSLGNYVTSSDKKRCNCLVTVHFYFKILCTKYTMHKHTFEIR